jgi:cyclophilin family peptidyl-prolyl cis-trans isomerase
MKNPLFAVAALALALPLAAEDAPHPAPSEIVAQAKAEEWVAIPAEQLLVMTLAPDAEGNARQVTIQLMPAPFSQGWVNNIRLLARSGWYDNISVNRVQDNYVVQWGDPNYDNPEATGETKKLPEGLKVVREEHYVVDGDSLSDANSMPSDQSSGDGSMETDAASNMNSAAAEVARIFSDHSSTEAEHDAAIAAMLAAAGLMRSGEPSEREKLAMLSIVSTQTPDAPEGWHERDSYAEWTEIWRGWPLANRQVGQWLDENGNKVARPMMPRHEAYGRGFYYDVFESWFWPVHCYGMVGVGRNLSPDTGSGAELYTVIGHAPRHLDRNIALVGRVIEGMEHLSSLPRGKGALGFYGPDEIGKRTPILTVRVASDLAPADQPRFEYLSTEGETFARYAEARANRRDPFFNVPAGGADICNIPVPIRRVAE